MYVDMLNQPDLTKYDLSSVEGGEKRKWFLKFIFWYIFFFLHLFASVCLHLWTLGIMAGSPCPQELVKKVFSDLNAKEITVSLFLFFPPQYKVNVWFMSDLMVQFNLCPLGGDKSSEKRHNGVSSDF